MIEHWLPVPGWEGFYEVSDHGRVRSVDRVLAVRGPHGKRRYRGRIIRPVRYRSGGGKRQNKSIYLKVSLSAPGRWRRGAPVHRLVMLAFVGPKPDHMEVCHGLRGQECNWLSNLRYDTRSANQQDSLLFGRRRAA